MIKKLIFITVCTVICTLGHAQSFNIGVRAGLNYGKFRGPLESSINEKFSIANGFHFGLNYMQNFTDVFSVRLELLYIQNGSKQTFGGEGTEAYYIIPVTGENLIERGQLDYELQVSNAYISLPLTAHVSLSDKWEILGGMYLSILVSPTANGRLEFESTDRPKQIVFSQSLDYKYNSDEAGQGAFVGRGPAILVDGVRVDLPRFAGAYYQYPVKNGNAINFLDYGLIGGITYNINRGFYISARADFGLADITNNEVDITRANVGEDGKFIYRDDKDTHFGIQASFGFKF